MAVIRQTIEGLQIAEHPPKPAGELREPIIRLQDGLVCDDRVTELATLLVAPPGQGKTELLCQIIGQLLPYVAAKKMNIFLLDVKGELWKRFGSFPSAIRVSPSDASDPAACWNIFSELAASKNSEVATRDIAKMLTKENRSEQQPFWENAANDLLVSAIRWMHAKERKIGELYGNWHLTDTLKRISIHKGDELNWYDLARQEPEFLGHIPNYFGNELEQAAGIISELLALIHSAFWGSFNTPDGTFSCIETVKSGGHCVFLSMDYANESDGARKVFETMLSLLLKHANDPENECLNWFLLDEGSVVGQVGTASALALGRAAGARLIMAIQSLDLLSQHMKEEERTSLLSLFGNLVIMNPQDRLSRKLLADRYGDALCSWSFVGPMQKPMTHVGMRPVVADSDFSLLKRKGDALCSFPRISNQPFYYHGYREELDV